MPFPLFLPCIKVSQPLGEFFLCSIPSGLLKEVAYWIPASAEQSAGGFLKLFGVQRRLSPERAKKIGQYIDSTEATFPNTIILSANFDVEDNYEEDQGSRWVVSERPDGCFLLTIPTAKKLASVIDGQHRLAGFDFTENVDRQQMQLPCAVFLDLPKAYQANIFATINFNQKRVDKSLAYQLFGYELDENDNKKWPPNLVALFIARVLNAEQDSPLRDHIKLALAEVEKSESGTTAQMEATSTINQDWAVSIAAIVEGIEKLISSNQSNDRNLLLSGTTAFRRLLPDDPKAPLRKQFLQGEDKAIYRVVADFFRAFNDVLWKNAKANSFIFRTVGILASFDLLKIALIARKIGTENTYDATVQLISPAKTIDFSDNFFHASGAGRVRIRNVVGIASSLILEEQLHGDLAVAQVRELISRYAAE
jgi:DNA phosphorothioation-associated DGQHR protein 1